MTEKPSTPTNRPMRAPSLSAESPSKQRALSARCCGAEIVAAGDEALGFREFGVVIVVDGGQRFAFFHGVAYALAEFETDAMVDGVFLFFPAAAERGQGDYELFAIVCGDDP